MFLCNLICCFHLFTDPVQLKWNEEEYIEFFYIWIFNLLHIGKCYYSVEFWTLFNDGFFSHCCPSVGYTLRNIVLSKQLKTFSHWEKSSFQKLFESKEDLVCFRCMLTSIRGNFISIPSSFSIERAQRFHESYKYMAWSVNKSARTWIQ